VVGGRVLSVLGVVGSPTAGGRTSAAVAAVLAGASGAGCRTTLIELAGTSNGSTSLESVTAEIDAADAVVVGSPVYRAGHSALLRTLLEQIQRGAPGERSAPLRGKAAALVMCGNSARHYLAVDGLRNVLAGFFATQTLSPGLFLDQSAFRDGAVLEDDARALAARHGAALVDLARAVRGSTALRGLTPQV
jgi:FMN reductase